MAATTAQREGRDRGGGPMKGKARKAPPPTFRTTVRRQAEALGVPADAFERALILGQLVALLSQHPRMRHAVAFKGGAIMRLVDQSPRLSRDLIVLNCRGVVSRKSGYATPCQRRRRDELFWGLKGLSAVAPQVSVFLSDVGP